MSLMAVTEPVKCIPQSKDPVGFISIAPNTRFYKGDFLLKRISINAVLVITLSLCSLTCQKVSQSNSNSQPPSNTSSVSDGSASQAPSAPKTHLKVGDSAPDFALTDTNGQVVKLSDFRGKKNVVLAFYVLAFTGG